MSDAVVAVDVGGTSIKAALVTRDETIRTVKAPTPAEGGQAVVDAIVDAVAAVQSGDCPAGGAVAAGGPSNRGGRPVPKLFERCQGAPEDLPVVAVGLAVPGIVDEATGVVRHAKNLGWDKLPLAQIVSQRCGLPVGLGHDMRAAALAEHRFGAGQGAEQMVFVGIGTGISAAVVTHGLALNGSAGEIGHGGAVSGEPCACGGRGCLETYASAAGIARHYAAASGREVSGAFDVARAVEAGDPIAQQVWTRAVDGLAGELSGVIRLLGGVRIVIGGGLSLAGPLLLDPLRAATKALLTVHPAPDIVPSAFGDRAGLRGAAMLAWRRAG